MKKILIATSALVATAGVAAADVTISGAARFGLRYENTGNAAPTPLIAKTQIETRLRFNIDANKETDSGVTFGGRIRMQHDENSVGASLNAANVSASYNGLQVTVGNVGTALDNATNYYASEIGFIGQSFGDSNGTIYSYNTGPYAAAAANRTGINAAYSIAGFVLEASYINPDQTLASLATVPPAGNVKAEFSVAAAYTYNQFTIAAGATQNGASIKNNDVYYVGVEYAVNDMANVGLQYHNNGDTTLALVPGADKGRTVTLYGNYKMDAITFRGYIANNNDVANSAVGFTKTAFGIGADYDLGGATLAGGVERGYAKQTRANLGVKFSF